MEKEITKIIEGIEKLNFSTQEIDKKITSSLRSLIFRTTSSKILKILDDESLSEEEVSKFKAIKKVNFDLFSPTRVSLPSYRELFLVKAEIDEIFKIVLENDLSI